MKKENLLQIPLRVLENDISKAPLAKEGNILDVERIFYECMKWMQRCDCCKWRFHANISITKLPSQRIFNGLRLFRTGLSVCGDYISTEQSTCKQTSTNTLTSLIAYNERTLNLYTWISTSYASSLLNMSACEYKGSTVTIFCARRNASHKSLYSLWRVHYIGIYYAQKRVFPSQWLWNCYFVRPGSSFPTGGHFTPQE